MPFRSLDDIRKARLPPNLEQAITKRMEMEAYPVGFTVNDSKTDERKCIDPL